MNCPHCAIPCDRDSVDVGVGTIHGPWGCWKCGWSEDDEYNLRERSPYTPDGVIDQYGNLLPKKVSL